MLDRIDALLFAAPAAYFCILAFLARHGSDTARRGGRLGTGAVVASRRPPSHFVAVSDTGLAASAGTLAR